MSEVFRIVSAFIQSPDNEIFEKALHKILDETVYARIDKLEKQLEANGVHRMASEAELEHEIAELEAEVRAEHDSYLLAMADIVELEAGILKCMDLIAMNEDDDSEKAHHIMWNLTKKETPQ